MTSTPDVFIVQKQTALERYTKRPLNIDFFEYLEKAGQSLEDLVQAHDAHAASRTRLCAALTHLGLSHELYNLDELESSPIAFFDPDCPLSGFQPKRGLVLALGGDGTLLHASHYVGGGVALAGINSCPSHSVGHLCSIRPDTIETSLEFANSGLFSTRTVRRLKTATSRAHRLPLGLNDVLFCNRHPAATSRYQLTISGLDKAPVGAATDRPESDDQDSRSEKQLSSGLWVAAPAGSTAAISSYGLPRLPLESASFLAAVREPYTPAGEVMRFPQLVLQGDSEELRIFCRMRQGMICVDGPDSSALIGFGESLHISLPADAQLRLVVAFGNS